MKRIVPSYDMIVEKSKYGKGTITISDFLKDSFYSLIKSDKINSESIKQILSDSKLKCNESRSFFKCQVQDQLRTMGDDYKSDLEFLSEALEKRIKNVLTSSDGNIQINLKAKLATKKTLGDEFDTLTIVQNPDGFDVGMRFYQISIT